MSTGSYFDTVIPPELAGLNNVHYDGGVPWMLMPDGDGKLHLAILADITPPEPANVNTIFLNLWTRYVPICFSGPQT
jgi:hypothetical protein